MFGKQKMLLTSNSCIITHEIQLDKEFVKSVDELNEKAVRFIASKDKNIFKSVQLLMHIYLESEEIVLFLLNVMFKPKFFNQVKNKRKTFRILDAFCKNFIKIDQKLYKSDFWPRFTKYKQANDVDEDILEKMNIISCISMPMAQMFSTLFYNKEIDLFYPTKLSKRSKIFLDSKQIEFLIEYYKLAMEDEYVYIQTYFLLILEIFTNKTMLKTGLTPALLDYTKIIVGK